MGSTPIHGTLNEDTMVLVRFNGKWGVAEKLSLRERFEADFIGEILEVSRTMDQNMVDILVKATKSRYDQPGKEYKMNAQIDSLQHHSEPENFQLFMERFSIISFKNKWHIKQPVTEIEILMRKIGYDI